MEDLLLDITEASERLHTRVNTLRYWRHVGVGPRSAKLGRRIVYRESDVIAWVDEQFAGTAARPDNGQ